MSLAAAFWTDCAFGDVTFLQTGQNTVAVIKPGCDYLMGNGFGCCKGRDVYGFEKSMIYRSNVGL